MAQSRQDADSIHQFELHIAIEIGDAPAVKKLLAQSDAKVWDMLIKRDSASNKTSLELAATLGYFNIVEMILNKNSYISDGNAYTPLAQAMDAYFKYLDAYTRDKLPLIGIYIHERNEKYTEENYIKIIELFAKKFPQWIHLEDKKKKIYSPMSFVQDKLKHAPDERLEQQAVKIIDILSRPEVKPQPIQPKVVVAEEVPQQRKKKQPKAKKAAPAPFVCSFDVLADEEEENAEGPLSEEKKAVAPLLQRQGPSLRQSLNRSINKLLSGLHCQEGDREALFADAFNILNSKYFKDMPYSQQIENCLQQSIEKRVVKKCCRFWSEYHYESFDTRNFRQQLMGLRPARSIAF